MARLDAATIQMAAQPLIGAGLLAQVQHARVRRLFMNQSSNYPGLTMFSALGRKPLKSEE